MLPESLISPCNSPVPPNKVALVYFLYFKRLTTAQARML